MSLRFLLDTNILSEPTKPRPHPVVLRRIAAHETEIATAAPVWHELLFGCGRLPPSRRRRRLEEYLHTVVRPALTILPYEETAAAWHAAQRARLAALGRPPAFVAGQIAAIAHVHDLVLVTANVHDFQPFEGVRVETWTD